MGRAHHARDSQLRSASASTCLCNADGALTCHERRRQLRRFGRVFGMAPEQLRCESSDERVDVYVLGVTLYELLAGKRPFEAASYPALGLEIVW